MSNIDLEQAFFDMEGAVNALKAIYAAVSYGPDSGEEFAEGLNFVAGQLANAIDKAKVCAGVSGGKGATA